MSAAFEFMPAPQTENFPNYTADVDAQKAVAEVQASLLIAKKFPRNQKQAVDRVLNACQRLSLAEKATYSYTKGGTAIQGASIRLAEVMATSWGNIDFGYRILESRPDSSLVEAYAWDKETNVKQVKTFCASHRRDTKKGSYLITDNRELYELIANQASRRVRACVLALIPIDVQEMALDECEKTIKQKIDITPERIKKMAEAFEALGVTKKMLEKRIQRSLDAIESGQFIGLTRVFNSLRDKMGEISDYFEFEEVAEPKKEPKKGMESLKNKVQEKALSQEQIQQSPELTEESEPQKEPPFVPCPNLEGQEDDYIYVGKCKSCENREGCPSWTA